MNQTEGHNISGHHGGTSGPYDALYGGMGGIVWPAIPGRMVRKAAELVLPGRALDAGCGDGKNAVFLAQNGWEVTSFDVSHAAIAAFEKRCEALDRSTIVGKLQTPFEANVCTYALRENWYDLVVSYGLFHCLDDNDFKSACSNLATGLRPNGLFAIATFNDLLPLPEGHSTPGLVLRPKGHIFDVLGGWPIEAEEFGTITEHHLPVVGCHQHSVTWALLRKPTI